MNGLCDRPGCVGWWTPNCSTRPCALRAAPGGVRSAHTALHDPAN